jgi:hypothetical protein
LEVAVTILDFAMACIMVLLVADIWKIPTSTSANKFLRMLMA